MKFTYSVDLLNKNNHFHEEWKHSVQKKEQQLQFNRWSDLKHWLFVFTSLGVQNVLKTSTECLLFWTYSRFVSNSRLL